MFRFNGLRFDPNGEGAAAPPSSDPNPTVPAGTAQGSGDDGAGTGSPAGGSLPTDGGQPTTAPNAQINWEERARSFQSRADRAEAELQRARQALGAEQPRTGTDEQPLTVSQLGEFLDRRSAIDRVVAQIPERYKSAHPQIAAHAYQYESPEALIAALEDSHAAEAAYREQVRQDVMREAGITPPANDAGGDPRPPANAASGGAEGAGPPTVQQMAKMSQAELDAVDKQFPGHLDGALKSLSQDTIYTG